jgi:hypothetical protein
MVDRSERRIEVSVGSGSISDEAPQPVFYVRLKDGEAFDLYTLGEVDAFIARMSTMGYPTADAREKRRQFHDLRSGRVS